MCEPLRNFTSRSPTGDKGASNPVWLQIQYTWRKMEKIVAEEFYPST